MPLERVEQRTNVAVATAPEPTTDSGADEPKVLHWYQRGSFPIALCGHVSPKDAWEPNKSPGGADICTPCQQVASQMIRDGKAWK